MDKIQEELDKKVGVLKKYGDFLVGLGVVIGDNKIHGFPASILPYPKTDIMDALKSCYMITCISGSMADSIRASLRDKIESQYPLLAYFIDDDKAKLVTWFINEVGSVDFKKNWEGYSPELSVAILAVKDILDKIKKEEETLTKDLDKIRKANL